MAILLLLWAFITQDAFESNFRQAQASYQAGDLQNAASALDQAASADSGRFDANNLHYLQGRIAEKQQDWNRAAAEFNRIPPGNVLRPLAAWHGAHAALRQGNRTQAEGLIGELPTNLPAELKMQLAKEAPADLAVSLYSQVNTREAKFQRARILNDTTTLWSLLRERNSDDVALGSARILSAVASSPREWMDLANAFLAQRAFDDALPIYEKLTKEPSVAGEAAYQRGRVFFLKEQYLAAIQAYESTADNFPRTDWERDALYQVASCYWRLGQYDDAEKAYTSYIAKFGDRPDDGATRNLVDVYRVSGRNSMALSLINLKLAGKVSTATRQVLLLVKAKILFSQNSFTASRDIFRQLGAMRMVNTPGGATVDEVHYFEALAQSKLGNITAAQKLWKDLASDPTSYFGIKALQRLGGAKELATLDICANTADVAVNAARNRISAVTRSIRAAGDPSSDVVTELIFMQLWDEAFLMFDQIRHTDSRNAADLAYLAGRYDRAITFADRLPESDMQAWPFVYPAAFRSWICSSSSMSKVDPLWLHAIIWQESKYNPNAASAAAARGLMQFIPETATAVGRRIGLAEIQPDNLYDPETSIRLGAAYWAELMDQFKLPELALAAYNGGPDNVRRWRAKLPNADVEFFVSDIGFQETKRYVQFVFGARAAYARPN